MQRIGAATDRLAHAVIVSWGWRRRGIANSLPDGTLASLLEPDGPGATAYLLTTNYRTILDYNCSNFYALTVGLLADSVAR